MGEMKRLYQDIYDYYEQYHLKTAREAMIKNASIRMSVPRATARSVYDQWYADKFITK